MVELRAEGVELGDSLGREDVGQVADVVRGLRQVFDLLGAEDREGKKKEAGKQPRKAEQTGALKRFHRTPLYVAGGRAVPLRGVWERQVRLERASYPFCRCASNHSKET